MNATSARGLFNATGKRSKPVAIYDLAGEIVKADALEREPNDFLPTPPEPTLAFVHAEIERLMDFPIIWESAFGDGAMGAVLNSCGFSVFGSDLIDRGAGAVIKNFFDFAPADMANIFAGAPAAMVTNPPFKECNWSDGRARWLLHALETLDVDYMALLLPLMWPGAAGLARFWADHPPSRVYLMRWRIDFTNQGGQPALFAWYVWDKKHVGETVLRMLDRKDIRQGELFGGAE